MHEFAFVFAGFAVGLVVGLTGVGGGSLMTPLLIFFFGVKPHLAIGTDLLFAAFTKMGGTVSLARARVVDWKIVGQTAAGSIPASLATLYVLQRLGPANPATQSLMTTTLGLALLLTAGATFYKVLRGKAAPATIAPELVGQATRARHWALPVLFGAVIGTLVTLTSVGAGAIGATLSTGPFDARAASLGRLVFVPRLGRGPAVPRPAPAAHRGGRHCPCRALDFGGRPGPRRHRFGRLAASDQAAGRLPARHLAGLAPGAQDAGPRDPFAALGAAGLCRRETDFDLKPPESLCL